MNPAFAASRRRLDDLQREWERLEGGNRLLDLVRQAQGILPEQKDWVVNAALSAGVSGLYTGMEEILKGLLALIDGYVPVGERSHQDILDQCSVAIPDLRPAIISADVHEALVALKGFRHFERHNYRFRFEPALVEANEARTERVIPDFIREIEAFMQAMSPDHTA